MTSNGGQNPVTKAAFCSCTIIGHVQSNNAKPVYAAVILTFFLQLAAIYWQPLQNLFGTTSLTLADLLITLAVSSLVFWWVEGEKWVYRRSVSGKM